MKKLGLNIDVDIVMRYPTVHQLINYINDANCQEFPLSPMQLYATDNNLSTHAVEIIFKQKMLIGELKNIILSVSKRHDILCLIYNPETHIQSYSAEPQINYEIFCNKDEYNNEVNCIKSSGLTNKENSKIVILQDASGNVSKFLWIINGLYADKKSFHFLLRELEQICLNQEDSIKPSLRYVDYCNYLNSMNASIKDKSYFENDLRFKDDLFAENKGVKDEFFIEFSEETTNALLEQQTHDSFKTRNIDLLVCALTLSIEESLNKKQYSMIVKSDGRELLKEFDFSNAVGCFEFYYLARLNLKATDFGDRIVKIKNNLKKAEKFGIFATIEYANGILLDCSDLDYDNKFSIFDYSFMSNSAKNIKFPISIFAFAKEGKLFLHFVCISSYNLKIAKEISSIFEEKMFSLIEFCRNSAKRLVVSDFELGNVTQDQLDSLFE